MEHNEHYTKSLLLLSILIMGADGILEESEMEAIREICSFENISSDEFEIFFEKFQSYTERQIFDFGIEEVSECSEDEKLRVFSWLYRISEADGKVHVKEVRFLLYIVKKAGIEFNDVIKYTDNLPSLIHS